MTKRTLIPLLAAAFALGAGGAWYVLRPHAPAATPAPATEAAPRAPAAAGERKVLYWHDPMVPGHRFDKPGKSPFMDMDLVPVYADEAVAGSGVAIDPRVSQNLGVRTAEVEETTLSRVVEATGSVRADERRVEVVQSRAMGYVERLAVRAVNERVRRGQVLAEVYSPDIVAAQEELLLALRYGDAALQHAARARLATLGLTAEQVVAIGKSHIVQRRTAIVAPSDGIVSEVAVRQGGTVAAGAPLMTLVDLATVWIVAEVPEAQAMLVAPGHRAEARIAALGDRAYAGRIDTVYPDLNEQTRTVRARLVVANPGGALLPGMLAAIRIEGPGAKPVLTVPAEAVIHTGRRAVVILAEDGGRFRPVEVETGAEAGGRTAVTRGLSRGQRVVVSGQFLIDSEASLKSALARLSGPEPQAGAHADHAAPAAPAGNGNRTTGKIESIDPAAGSLTIEHGPIPGLRMPAMTMGFPLKDRSKLATLKPGDRVDFEVAKEGEGQYVITDIRVQGGKP